MADHTYSPGFWSSVATIFKNNPAVIFDLYNEPHDTPIVGNDGGWGCWQNGGASCTTTDGGLGTWQIAGMTELLAAVRSAGATQPVMLGGLGYASDLSQWLAHEPVDPHQPAQLVATFTAIAARRAPTLATAPTRTCPRCGKTSGR
jgi:endoglucanase